MDNPVNNKDLERYLAFTHFFLVLCVITIIYSGIIFYNNPPKNFACIMLSLLGCLVITECRRMQLRLKRKNVPVTRPNKTDWTIFILSFILLFYLEYHLKIPHETSLSLMMVPSFLLALLPSFRYLRKLRREDQSSA